MSFERRWTDNETRLLDLLYDGKAMTTTEIANVLRWSNSKVAQILSRLRKKGALGRRPALGRKNLQAFAYFKVGK